MRTPSKFFIDDVDDAGYGVGAWWEAPLVNVDLQPERLG